MAEDFIYNYFIEPIVSRTGYNAVNTLAYAAIALICLYFIYRWFSRSKIPIDSKFALATLPFVLLGSTMRVVTDSIDTGVMQTYVLANPASPASSLYRVILSSHIYDYGFLSASPGIYVVVAAIFLSSLFLLHRLNKLSLLAPFGMLLWLFHFAILLPMAAHWQYAAIASGIAAVASFIAIRALQHFVQKNEFHMLPSLAIFAHAFDGAATYTAINLFSSQSGNGYFEQHVLSSAIGTSTPLGFFAFFLLKLSFATLASYLIIKDKAPAREKAFVFLVIIILGLAPGLRDVLRMLLGA
jgi:uncharacterized membrane protein